MLVTKDYFIQENYVGICEILDGAILQRFWSKKRKSARVRISAV